MSDLPEPDWTTLLTDPLYQKFASDLWQDVIAEMKSAGTLARINAPQIKRYIIASILYDRAVADIDAKGAILTNKRTKLASYNPSWSVMKDCDTLAHRYEESLGLNPRRRGQVKAAKQLKKSTNADAFL